MQNDSTDDLKTGSVLRGTELHGVELVSALADGFVDASATDRAIALLERDAHARAAWHGYHLIGDLLRTAEPAAALRGGGADFTRSVMARVAAHPLVPASLPASAVASAPLAAIPSAALARGEAANDAWGWKLVAGMASVAAVSALAWNLLAQSPVQPTLAAVPAPSAPVVTAATQSEPVMIRDARLDELLAAHRQFGGTSALQAPAGFLRNATFEVPKR